MFNELFEISIVGLIDKKSCLLFKSFTLIGLIIISYPYFTHDYHNYWSHLHFQDSVSMDVVFVVVCMHVPDGDMQEDALLLHRNRNSYCLSHYTE